MLRRISLGVLVTLTTLSGLGCELVGPEAEDDRTMTGEVTGAPDHSSDESSIEMTPQVQAQVQALLSSGPVLGGRYSCDGERCVCSGPKYGPDRKGMESQACGGTLDCYYERGGRGRYCTCIKKDPTPLPDRRGCRPHNCA